MGGTADKPSLSKEQNEGKRHHTLLSSQNTILSSCCFSFHSYWKVDIWHKNILCIFLTVVSTFSVTYQHYKDHRIIGSRTARDLRRSLVQPPAGSTLKSDKDGDCTVSLGNQFLTVLMEKKFLLRSNMHHFCFNSCLLSLALFSCIFSCWTSLGSSMPAFSVLLDGSPAFMLLNGSTSS